MGTVGLAFGSPTSGAGFDVTSTVSQILAIQQGVETPWKTQLTSLEAQNTAFSTIGTDLATLATDLQALTDADGVFAEKEGSSSNTDLLALTSASPTAAAGSHTVVVNNLAVTSSSYSSEVTNASDTLTGGITIQVGSGNPATVNIPTGGETLAELAASINQAGVGVSASVVSDENGSRLSLVSSTGGAAGTLTVTSNLEDGSTPVTIAGGVAGLDASLTVDGVPITSASNTVTTAIPGVTFQLLGQSGTAQVEITNDTTDISSAMSAFVTAYNTVVGDLKTQEGDDSSGNPEPLFGDPTISLLQTQLSQALLGGAASGSISSITQLGVTVNQDGTLTYSDSDMQSALNSDFSDVMGFLQNDQSFGSNMTTVLNGLSSTNPTGAVFLAEQQNTNEESVLNTDVSNEEALLAAQKTSLTTELNEANQVLQSIPSQLNQVNELYSAVTGFDTNTNG